MGDRPAEEARDIVLTPGGYRPRSDVHQIPTGNILDESVDSLRILHASGRVVSDLGPVPPRRGLGPLMPANVALHPRAVPAYGSGWIAYAYWTNNTGTPLSTFTTTFRVPPAPVTDSGQTIFLFPGIQNSAFIYQPVLQWGPSAAGGGAYWSVASWYVDGPSGPAFHTNLTRVSTGDTLVGVMDLTGQTIGVSGPAFSYNCHFEGIANTSLPIQNVQELTWCCQSLEAYGITRCSDYPATTDTVFGGIGIQTGAANPAVNWTPVDAVTDCGQHATVESNANPGGEVDIAYVEIHVLAGKATALRVHDLKTGYGPQTDFLDVEVVFRLDSQPGLALGFQLRQGSGLPDHREMLDVLRDAFADGSVVSVMYSRNGPNSGVVHRAWLG